MPIAEGTPQDDARKAACNELAGLLAAEDGLHLARLLQTTGTLVPPSEPPRASAENASDEGAVFFPIGPWKPTLVEDEVLFVRDEILALTDVWAPTPSIRQRKERPRICLVGESVAAGYFYAPELTCAQVLERQLAAGSAERFEVLDLTRLGMDAEHLVETAISAIQLQPDLLVIFAGNNWAYHNAAFPLVDAPDALRGVERPRDPLTFRQAQARRLRGQGIAGLHAMALADESEIAEGALEELSRINRISGIPVVLVIPEVNLADWQTRHPVGWLPGDGSARWHTAYRDARTALAGGREDKAEAAIGLMLALDGGSCPTSHRMLAQLRRKQGRAADAIVAARGEVDSATWHPDFIHGPRVSAATQSCLRAAADRFGFVVVDLPAIFSEVTHGGLPGRRLFLDYCHLTVEGIELGMSAVADAIVGLRRKAGSADPGTASATIASEPLPPRLDARANIAAAIHNAHLNLADDDLVSIVRYWCAAALDAAPDAGEGMSDFLLAKSSRCPPVFTEAHARLYASSFRLSSKAYEIGFLEVDLIEIVSDLMARAGRPVRKRIEQTLLEQFSLGMRPVDLVHRFYRGSRIAHYGMTHANHDIYRAVWPVSEFYFVTDGEAAVQLDLTCRRHGAVEAGGEEVSVSINGAAVHAAAPKATWTGIAIRLEPSRLRRGINKLALTWPDLAAIGDTALGQAVKRLEMGLPAQLFPVFGEVFSLKARIL